VVFETITHLKPVPTSHLFRVKFIKLLIASTRPGPNHWQGCIKTADQWMNYDSPLANIPQKKKPRFGSNPFSMFVGGYRIPIKFPGWALFG